MSVTDRDVIARYRDSDAAGGMFSRDRADISATGDIGIFIKSLCRYWKFRGFARNQARKIIIKNS
jgi:hypothetical protein